MKYTWRITKYNPFYRNEHGTYIKNEWTSYSDIGKRIEGKILTEDEYLNCEQLYIHSILKLMEASKINSLHVAELEVYDECIFLENGTILSLEDIIEVVKCILREKIWCKLTQRNAFYVHFGYDYHMYIGSSVSSDVAICEISKAGLFVEKLSSPYLTDDER